MPRPCHCRRVAALPKAVCFKPQGIPLGELAETTLPVDGLEAVRLADYQGLNMDEAAARMGVSRHTFGRLLRKARRCVAQALIEGRALRIEGGVCMLLSQADAQGETRMDKAILVAVPSDAPGGLDAAPSGHFGHCDAYTLARVENGEISQVDVHYKEGHEHGNCLQPVQELARQAWQHCWPEAWACAPSGNAGRGDHCLS